MRSLIIIKKYFLQFYVFNRNNIVIKPKKQGLFSALLCTYNRIKLKEDLYNRNNYIKTQYHVNKHLELVPTIHSMKHSPRLPLEIFSFMWKYIIEFHKKQHYKPSIRHIQKERV